MMRVQIVGNKVSGRAAFALAEEMGYEVQLFASDKALDDSICDILVVSPGIPLNKEGILKKRKHGAEVIGEAEFALRHTQHTLIGITGTNGKTTAVTMLAEALNREGISAAACGNNGYPLSEAILSEERDTVLIVELSSYQIETLQTPCLDCAVILNIAPDHLDRYASYQEYAQTKCRIKWALKPDGVLFVDQSVVGEWGDELHIPGRVSFMPDGIEDVASYIVGKPVRVTAAQLPHRLEHVCDGWINDSKATNVAAVEYALSQCEGPVVLILGGVRKGESFTPLLCYDDKIEHCIIFGQDAASIAQELSPPLDVEVVKTVEESVQKGEQTGTKKAVILFSPGCASYDTHSNYIERGEAFKRAVYARKGIVHEQA